MLLRRRTKRKLILFGLVFAVLFVLIVGGAGAFGWDSGGFKWPNYIPFSWIPR